MAAPADVRERLAAVTRTALLDTPPEEAFDRLTRMAARLLGAPVSLITLVTEDRQFFKSAMGLPEPWASRRSAPLSHSFCRQVAVSGEPLVVEDTRRHPLLRSNPAVREFGWIAYAGVPLVTRDGFVVGSFSVVDGMPRLWSERDVALLKDLAACAASEIELRVREGQEASSPKPHGNGGPRPPDVFEDAGIPMGVASAEGRWTRVNRALAELLLEPGGYLACCLVREGESADAGGVHLVTLDKEADPLYEAERLSRSRTCKHEHGAVIGLDRESLGFRRYLGHQQNLPIDQRPEVLDFPVSTHRE